MATLDGWIERLDEESGLPAGPLRIAARIDLGYRSIEGDRISGQLVPREGGGSDYPGSMPAPRVNRADAAVAIDLNAGPFTIAATRNPTGDVRGRTEALYALYGTRFVEVWAGRRPLSFGRSRYDGIVLGPTARFDGFGIELPAGFRLPAFLRHLGEVRVSQTFARMDRSGPIDNPLFLGTRVIFAPSAAIAIGLNRAVIFGGAGNQPVTFERTFWMLLGQTDIGSKDSDFENQVASIDLHWRPGSSGWSLFGEYGFDDAGGAFFRVPAFTIGARLTRLPGLSALGAAAEFTHMTSHCCGHPPWYQHAVLAEGWSDRGVLLGHPLGGEGSELAVTLRGDFARARLITEARFRITHRGEENLLVPEFEGTGTGAELYAMARLHPNVRLVLELSGDRFPNSRDRHDAWIGLRGVF